MAGLMSYAYRALSLCIALLAASVFSQTITTTDALGESIVELVTVDPAGLPVTQTLQTLTDPLATSAASTPTPPGLPPNTALPASSTTSSTPSLLTATATTPDVQVGPVGAPPATTGPAGPTVYTYTTTNADGATIGVIDTFTPTYPVSVPFTPTSTGTVLDYSQYLSIIGAHTTAANPSSSGCQRSAIQGGWLGLSMGLLVGALSGAWMTFA